ncbi:Os02g0111500 [Oryza sativa Japonica Group]|uniref:Os02g0111500 protein n=1 Tax=Oryza sativa subsp. japonica TaxID=39947 RepID=A0A0P0VDV2_ORYSJ|nr:hypothetical protein EE612_008376 [Oryza sativa]BAS76620.1 Os02g0111500 [Oryza sativa Japonica Group]
MVRLPHVPLHLGLAILDAALKLMVASSRVVARIIHGTTPVISLYVLYYDSPIGSSSLLTELCLYNEASLWRSSP